MTLSVSFQAFPYGYWLTAEFSKGKVNLSHRYSLEDELELHKENISKGEYSKEDIEKRYKETENWCVKASGRTFEDECECRKWLESKVTNDDVYWEKVS